MGDVWASGAAYEQHMGAWSRPVAAAFVDRLDVGPGLRWLDVGCGTGALSGEVLERWAPSSLVAVEPSAAFRAWAQEHLSDARASVVAGDATTLPGGRFDVVVSGLVLNFVPDPGAALRAMGDAAPSGLVAAYVWDYADGMQLLRAFWAAAVQLDPAVGGAAEGVRFPLCRPGPLAALWREAGLCDVQTWPVEVQRTFAGADEVWRPFLGGQGPAAAYAVSLPERERGALRREVLQRVPHAADGTISLGARAWAVRGRVPETGDPSASGASDRG